MHPLRNAASLCALAICLLAPAASSQASDSAVFHRGQWGVDFRIGSGFAGVGALHFNSPTRALLLDFNGGYNHNSATVPGPSRVSNVNGTLSLGTRAYHHVDSHIYRWTTLGLSLAYSHQSDTQAGTTQTTEAIGAGIFVNLGGTWLVTPHLGLGAQWQADVTYTHGSVSTPFPGSGRADLVAVTLARVALTGQLYF